ncbi:6-phospho-3-hexuloisomerase [Paenibacillus antarcticus]|uniref:6-phospho 3-hexuloisomerase n=1 Tax=Paenibacillus antarcticus TaxID=253703 RepID=A0A168LX73_9BACL|nr:6-phospho-3-hexuloisomerase [Paenibacillus antarcticus]OAB43962.1 6-phospho 3-hexuloisomerase [Paenibacillus antarcticus]
MNTMEYAQEIVNELQHSVSQLGEEAEQVADLLLRSGKVFVAGAGRSGLMGRAFAMRLMQVGKDAYVVGETITPGMDKVDVLVIGSGSGETKGLISIVENARAIGAVVVAFTIIPDSTIGRLADYIVKLPGATKDQSGNHTTIQPMASLFEQTMLVVYDAIILRMMEKTGQDSTRMFGKHANLE